MLNDLQIHIVKKNKMHVNDNSQHEICELFNVQT
jgi:hypothetical protein